MKSTRSPRKQQPWIVQAALYTGFFLALGLVIAGGLELLKWIGRGL